MTANTMCISCLLSKQEKIISNYLDANRKAKYIEQVQEILDSSEDEYVHFRNDLEQASRLVYLTDNCGEIVLDKLFIKCLQKCYPEMQIIVVVRGETVINDATLRADVIISKGQGNFESLFGEGLTPYYIFLCKCELFVHRFGLQKYESVFVSEERTKTMVNL